MNNQQPATHPTLVALQPIALAPSGDAYALSQHRPPRLVSEAEFLRLADTAHAVVMSVDGERVVRTAYGWGLGRCVVGDQNQ